MDTGDRVLRLRNFMGHERGTFQFPNRGLVRLQGRSGAGKSTVLAAFAWVMGYGPETIKGVDQGLVLTAGGTTKAKKRPTADNTATATTSAELSWEHVSIYRQCRPPLWTVSVDGSVVSDDVPGWLERRYGGAVHKEMIPVCMYLEQNAQCPFVGAPTDAYKILAQHCLRPIPVKAATDAIKKDLIKREDLAAGVLKDRWARHSQERPDCLSSEPIVAVVRSEDLAEVLDQPGLCPPEAPEDQAPTAADVSTRDQAVGERKARLEAALARQESLRSLFAKICPTESDPDLGHASAAEWARNALAAAEAIIDSKRRSALLGSFFAQGVSLAGRAPKTPRQLAQHINEEKWADYPIVPGVEARLGEVKAARGALVAGLKDLIGDAVSLPNVQAARIGDIVDAKRAECAAAECCLRAQRAWLMQATNGPDWAEAAELQAAWDRSGEHADLVDRKTRLKTRLGELGALVGHIDQFRQAFCVATGVALCEQTCARAAAADVIRVAACRADRLAAAKLHDQDPWARLGLAGRTKDPTSSFLSARSADDSRAQSDGCAGPQLQLECTTEIADMVLGRPCPEAAALLELGARPGCSQTADQLRVRLVQLIGAICHKDDQRLMDLVGWPDCGTDDGGAPVDPCFICTADGQSLRCNLGRIFEDLVGKHGRLQAAADLLGVPHARALLTAHRPGPDEQARAQALLRDVSVQVAAQKTLERLQAKTVGDARQAIVATIAASTATGPKEWSVSCPCCDGKLVLGAADGSLVRAAQPEAQEAVSWTEWVLAAPAAASRGRQGLPRLALAECNQLVGTLVTLPDAWDGGVLAGQPASKRDEALQDLVMLPEQIRCLEQQARLGLDRLYAGAAPIAAGPDAECDVQAAMGQLHWLERLIGAGPDCLSMSIDQIRRAAERKANDACTAVFRHLNALCADSDLDDHRLDKEPLQAVSLATGFTARVDALADKAASERDIRRELAGIGPELQETETALQAGRAVQLHQQVVAARQKANLPLVPPPEERVFPDARALDRFVHGWAFEPHKDKTLAEIGEEEVRLTTAVWQSRAGAFATQASTREAAVLALALDDADQGKEIAEDVFLAASQLAGLLRAGADADVPTLQTEFDAALAEARQTKELAARWSEFVAAEDWVLTARSILQEYNEKEDALSASRLAAMAIDAATHDAICSVIADVEKNANRLVQDLFAGSGGGVTVRLAVDGTKNTLSTQVRIGTREGDARRVGLSGGERSRVDMAVQAAACVALDCPFLLIDEGTGALDPSNAQLSIRALRWLAQDRLIIVTSHQVMEDCSRSEFDRVIEVQPAPDEEERPQKPCKRPRK